MSRRFSAGLGVALALVVPAAAATGALGSESAASLKARASVAGHLEADPPLAHARPSGFKPALVQPGPSPWEPLAHPPSFVPGTMLLQSDGTVLVHEETETGGTRAWYRFTPDANGSYADGTWSKAAEMPRGYEPTYFASAVLPDGQMIVEGGEYNGGSPEGVWTNKGAIYNPVNEHAGGRSRRRPGWTNIGDAQSDVLANGTFMLSQACQNCLSASFSLTHRRRALQRKRSQLDRHPRAGQERPQRRGGLDARAQRPAADGRHLADADHRAVHAHSS